MFTLPITERLNKSRNVLIAGAGGGFDVFSGLPLFFALERQGKKVHLANWTFSEIDAAPGASERLSDFLVAVSADTKGSYYFRKALVPVVSAEREEPDNILFRAERNAAIETKLRASRQEAEHRHIADSGWWH